MPTSALSTKSTIEDLKQAGYDVWFDHRPFNPNDANLLHRKDATPEMWSSCKKAIESRFGESMVTIATIAKKNENGDLQGPVYMSYAFCSPENNYNRKIGNQIALGRAIKHILRCEVHINEETQDQQS